MPTYGRPTGEFADMGSGSAPWFIARVAAVNEDGTVSLDWGSDPVVGVRCASGYTARQIGDSVLVARVNGELQVLGRNGSPDGQDGIDVRMDSAEDDIVRLDNIRPRFSWGTTNPGAGWTQGFSTFFRDRGNGRVDIYYQTSGGGGGGPSEPPERKSRSKVSIYPDNRRGWRSSGQTDSEVKQGAWVGQNWSGGWFYGDKIRAACEGRNVERMFFTLARTARGGWSRGIPAHLNMHQAQNPTNVTPYGPLNAMNFKLSLRQYRRVELRSTWVQALAEGTTKGFMLSGSGRGDYLICSNLAGRLDIVFYD